MESSFTFTWTVNIRVVIHDVWFIGSKLVEDLFYLGYADFALQGSCHLHAANSIALPDDCWCHNHFQLLSDFVAAIAISAVMRKMIAKCISSSISTWSFPIGPKFFSSCLYYLPNISKMFLGPLFSVSLCFLMYNSVDHRVCTLNHTPYGTILFLHWSSYKQWQE